MAQRTVRFYLIVDHAHQRYARPFPFAPLRTAIKNLSNAVAYVMLDNMEVLGSPYSPTRSAASGGAVPLIALDKITRHPGLRIERNRHFRPLALAANDKLAEPTFYSVFDNNVLAVMRNSGGAPTSASFRDYINKLKLVGTQRIDIIPLLDRERLRAFDNVDKVTKFTFAVGSEVSENVFVRSPGILAIIRQMRRGRGQIEIEVAMKVKPRGTDATSDLLRDEIRGLVNAPGELNSLTKAEMVYRRVLDGRATTYDFLQEVLTTQTEVELAEDSNQPKELAAARGMGSAYESMLSEINLALDVASE